MRYFANELGQLYQSIRTVKGTNTVIFIPKHEVPFKTKIFTYGKKVCEIKPDKVETHRTRLTVGGNLLEYCGLMSTPTAKVTTTKMPTGQHRFHYLFQMNNRRHKTFTL